MMPHIDPMATLTDLERMQAAHQWPNWPILPIVHKTTGECACLFEQSLYGTSFMLVYANMWSGRDAIATAERKLINANDLPALALDWRVD